MNLELLNPQRFGCNGRLTCESDCYGLGIVIHVAQRIHYDRPSFVHPQVLTGRRQFHRIFGCTPMPAMHRGEHSEKPFDISLSAPPRHFFGSVQSLWSGSHSSPTARRLLEHLSTACLTWIPPAYPIVRVDASSVTNSDSSDSL